MSHQKIIQLFPNLSAGDCSITSPISLSYNCIAWAAGDTSKVWWPDLRNIGYWPSGVPRIAAIESFISAFATLGYSICQSAAHESAFEKIALYTKPTGRPTHAARQLNSGRWTSKIGRMEDIEHDLNELNGTEYGTVACIMKRPV